MRYAPADVSHDSFQGLISATPVASKSARFPVTTVIPCTMAIAAINASRSARGSGTCNRAHFRATAESTGSVRSRNSGNTCRGKRATGGGPDTESFCRQSPEVGAGWFNDHARICAGGAQQCAFLPQLRGVRRNPYSYRNWEPRVGNHPRPPGSNQFVRLAPMANDRPDIQSRHEKGNAS